MEETELRYLPLEKAALALLQAAKKLPHYFQASTVTVLTDLSLKCYYNDWISREGSLNEGYIWDHLALNIILGQ
jgi:hypothetical protein